MDLSLLYVYSQLLVPPLVSTCTTLQIQLTCSLHCTPVFASSLLLSESGTPQTVPMLIGPSADNQAWMADWCPSPEERNVIVGVAVSFVYAIDSFANG